MTGLSVRRLCMNRWFISFLNLLMCLEYTEQELLLDIVCMLCVFVVVQQACLHFFLHVQVVDVCSLCVWGSFSSRSTLITVREGRKEMFYLTMHSTHFIYGYIASDVVKYHSDSERGNPLPPHGLQGFFNMHHPTDRIAHTMAFGTPVVEHWLEREIAQ